MKKNLQTAFITRQHMLSRDFELYYYNDHNLSKVCLLYTSAYGEKVGSSECEEGKIFIEPQGFCVLADIGIEEGCAKQALDSVETWLDTKYGIVLQDVYKRQGKHVQRQNINMRLF